MRIHQVLVDAAASDPTTKVAQLTRERLRRLGHSELYASHVDASVAGVVHPLEHLGDGAPDDVLIVRMSRVDDDVVALLHQHPGRIVLAHRALEPISDRAVDPSQADRDRLRALRPLVTAAWADSRFDASDLESVGYQDVAVIAPAVDPNAATDLGPDPMFAALLDQRAPENVLLAVGRCRPSERLDLLIEAIHLLVAHHRPYASLVVVGAPSDRRHQRQLEQLAESFGLTGAWFTGAISDEQLGEVYRRADAYVNLGSRESYCAPALAAMAASVPVVGTTAGALRETTGGAGILLDEPDPIAVAEALDLVLDPEARARLVLEGRDRVQQVRPGPALDRLEAFLTSRLGL